jgi:hypothetical protein
LNAENLQNLIAKFDLVKNFAYNVGFIYTDIMMLNLAVPGETATDYMYYVAFYVGDLFFRFLFREASDDNCWYPWNICYVPVPVVSTS